MSDTHETTADIIAEMRKTYVSKGGAGYCGEVWIDLLRYADRLEAAHKRERGDCAKLREALKLCMDEMCNRCRDLASARGNPLPCLQGCEPVRKAKAALSAPPRNCDVYDNESCRMAYHLHGDGLMTMQAFADWLLAPATEKEGGDK